MSRFVFLVVTFVLAPFAHANEEAGVSPLVTLEEASPLFVAGIRPMVLRPGSLQNRAVIVTFFASWCPPCTIEFQELANVQSQISADDVTVVGVNLHEDFGGQKNPGRMVQFLTRTKPEFALLEGNEEISSAFGEIDRIPTMIIYDRDGCEVWRFVHVRGSDKTHANAEEILAALEKAGIALGTN